MDLVFLLLGYRQNSDRREREIVLRDLTLPDAQRLFGLESSELMYECFDVPESVAHALQALAGTPLDPHLNDD